MGRITFISVFIFHNRARLWLVLSLGILGLGCRERPSQLTEEYNVAGYFVSRMGSYENRFPGAPITNLQEVVERTSTQYPARWHHELRAFGKDAGFTNSIFEKYVFTQTPFSNHVVGGDIVLLSAEPFPDRDGEYGRMIFSKWRAGWDGWMFKWYPEEQVQEFFREAGQRIPKAVPMPPLSDLPPPYKPPLRSRVTTYFEDITRALGLGTALGRYLMWLTFGLVVVVGILVCWFGLRKDR